MAHVEVRDYVIWARHVRGAPQLAERLQSLPAGKTIRLRVDGVRGLWEKMRDRPDGTSTPGLKPVGDVAKHWRQLFETKRGTLVEISVDASNAESFEELDPLDRASAWEAFKALTRAGWRSERPYGPRDELHDR